MADELRLRSKVGLTPISAATDVSWATTSDIEPSCDTEASVRSPNFFADVPVSGVTSSDWFDLSVTGVLVPEVAGELCAEVPRSSCKLYSMPLMSANCLSFTSASSRVGNSTVVRLDERVSTPRSASRE